MAASISAKNLPAKSSVGVDMMSSANGRRVVNCMTDGGFCCCLRCALPLPLEYDVISYLRCFWICRLGLRIIGVEVLNEIDMISHILRPVGLQPVEKHDRSSIEAAIDRFVHDRLIVFDVSLAERQETAFLFIVLNACGIGVQ